ncbi:hypothetical protein [Aeromicrobium fastidiosum]|uniref:Uncharacterized protein n=1 Tax=Aeromicrobium fastidiosum TaxID=52699 RepID=A0A641AL39_9ACTN|nr:hypothetical protein [Aeromicrobium fastidiosum]KAA1375968.1 hypothetical protein ESP62_010925 [Aeromicrobium fastidiosum]MBP2392172.1 hypothetical protein [Aeromicrobium fastidiosum]
MKRLVLLAVLAVAVTVGAAVQIASDGEPGDARRVADVAPFPRTTKPLPVPEMSILEGPWKDETPGIVPRSALPVVPDGFVERCTACATPLTATPLTPIPH